MEGSQTRRETKIFSDSVRRYSSHILIIGLFVVLALAVAGCEDYNQWSPPQPPEPEEKTEVEAPPPEPSKVKTE